MKKAYSKPVLYAESFELAEHISSCTTAPGQTTVTYRDGSSCSYTDGGDITLYNQNVTGCTNNYDDFMFPTVNDYIESLKNEGGGCYNAFSDGNAFAS